MGCANAEKDEGETRWTCSVNFKLCPYIYPNEEVCKRETEEAELEQQEND